MNAPENETDEIRLLHWANVLLRHRILIVLLMAAAGAAALGLCWRARPLYTAEAKVAPNRDAAMMSLRSLFLSNLPKSSSELVDRLSMSYQSAYYMELLQSDLLLAPLLERRWTGGQRLRDVFPLEKPDERSGESQLLWVLKSRVIDISQDRLSGVLTITCTTPDPALSAEMANAMVTQLQGFLASQTTSGTGSLLRAAEARTSNTESRLKTAEEQLRDFRRKHQATTLLPDEQVQLQRLELNLEIGTDLYKTLKSRVDLLRLSEQDNLELIDVIQPAKVPVSASWPPTIPATAGAMLFGLLLGVAIAFTRNGIRLMMERNAPGFEEFARHLRSLNWIAPGVILLLPPEWRRRRRRRAAPPAATMPTAAEPPLGQKAEGH
jgi:uncharacterized protein involved in exopolysaccharide biosynthesis